MDSLLNAAKNALKQCLEALEDNAYDVAAAEIKVAKDTLKLIEEEQPMNMEIITLKYGENAPAHFLNPDGLCWIGCGAYGPQRATWTLDRPSIYSVRYANPNLSPHFNKNRLLHYSALPILHYEPWRDTRGELSNYPVL